MWKIERQNDQIIVVDHMSGRVIWKLPSDAYGQQIAEGMVDWHNDTLFRAWQIERLESHRQPAA